MESSENCSAKGVIIPTKINYSKGGQLKHEKKIVNQKWQIEWRHL